MSDASISRDSEPPGERVLPDRKICQVRPIGTIRDFANCMVERPVECPHVLYFGEGNICRNPEWKEFLAGLDSISDKPARRDSR